MRTNFNRFLIKTALITTILKLVVAGNSYAVDINPEIANINYWYGDDDIRGILNNRLGDRVYVAPAVPNVPALIHDVAEAAIFDPSWNGFDVKYRFSADFY